MHDDSVRVIENSIMLSLVISWLILPGRCLFGGAVRACAIFLALAPALVPCPASSAAVPAKSRSQSRSLPLTQPSIGRLNHAGFRTRSFCTAFVTSDGFVITAAHCIPHIADDPVHVLLGYSRGKLTYHLKTPAGSYLLDQKHDIAVLCRKTALTKLIASRDPGINLGIDLDPEPPRKGDRVIVEGYGMPKQHKLQREHCSLLSHPAAGQAKLDCPLSPGMSGAPVIRTDTADVIGIAYASGAHYSAISLLTEARIRNICQF